MYDVAIIGAGPAGSTAARYLAKEGLHVCLIDKEEFPRDKPCGGALPFTLFDEFKYLKSRKSEFVKCIGSTGYLHSPDRRTSFKGKIPLIMTFRTDFDNILLETARENGADLILKTRIKNLQFSNDGVVITTNRKNPIHSKVIIGADGVNSTVARSTGLNRRWRSGSLVACKVAEIPVPESKVIQYYGNEHEYHFFSGTWDQIGYGWVFPKQDTVNVGLGIIDYSARGLPKKFLAFLKFLQSKGFLPENSELPTMRGALVPVAGPLKSTVHDRCLLVGDAAGMVNPLTGGGIEYAMVTGKMAAKTLTKAFMEDEFTQKFLISYEKAWKKKLANEFRIQLLIQKLLTSPISSVLFEIGNRDKEIQELALSLMKNSKEGFSGAIQLIVRAAYVCLREALIPNSQNTIIS